MPLPTCVGVDVLVGVGPARERDGVQPGLVGERRRARRRAGRACGGEVAPARRRGGDTTVSRSRRPVGQRRDAHLQREVGDDGDEVAVAGALAVAVDGALHLRGAGRRTPASALATAQPVSFWVWMPTGDASKCDATSPTMRCTSWGSEPPLVSHSTRQSAPSVAAASSTRRVNSGLRLVAVEEVLGVEEHPQARGLQELDRVADHGHALVERGAQRLGDVVVPALARRCTRWTCRRRPGCRSVGSSSTLPSGAAGRPEGHQRRRGVRSQLGRRPAGRTRRPSGWRRDSRPRCSARRASRAARRCAACRRRSARCPRTARRRAGSCRRSRPSRASPERAPTCGMASVVSVSFMTGSRRSTQSLYRSTLPRTASR